MWQLWCAGVGASELITVSYETKETRVVWSVNDGAFNSYKGSHPAFEIEEEWRVRWAMETIRRELNRDGNDLIPPGGTFLDYIEDMRSPQDTER